MASAVIGSLLMLAMVAALSAPAMLAATEKAREISAYADEARAHADAAERAAACAREPGSPDCPSRGQPMSDAYVCHETLNAAWTCLPRDTGVRR